MFVSAVLAASLAVSLPPLSSDSAPLAPGRPAGFQQAQGESREIVLFSAIGLVTATGLGILLIGHEGGVTSSSTTVP
jgi:hypothetical protein